ncbi:Uncharacterised protein [Klebsiella oxytoca]|nr:Uncharacterised protein [Klebsiella oxytoca]
MVSSTVFVCQLVVTPLSHGDSEDSQATGLPKSVITPTVSDDTLFIVSDVLYSNETVSVSPASAGIRVTLATRTEPVVVLSAFSPASYVNAEPVPEFSQNDRSTSMPPLLIRLPSARVFFSIVSWPDCVVRLPSVADTRLVNAVTALASAFLLTFELVVVRSFCSLAIAMPWLVSVLSCWLTLDCRPVMALLFAATPDSVLPTRLDREVSEFPWLVNVVPCCSTFCVRDCSAVASAFFPRLVSSPLILLTCALCAVDRELSSSATEDLFSLNCVCSDSRAVTSALSAVIRAFIS